MKSVWGLFAIFVVFFTVIDGQPLQYRMIRRICPSGSYHDPIKDRCRRVPGGGDMIKFNFDARCSGGFQGLLANSKKSRFYFVCQRYAVLTCRCKRNERFDRSQLRCTKFKKKLSKQERKSYAVVDNIIKKYKCIDHSDEFEVYAPPTTTAPVEETTFDYYTAFRKAIADFNMAWSASGSVEDTTAGIPKISWSTVAKTTSAPLTTESPTTTEIRSGTTTCGIRCLFTLGPISKEPSPNLGPAPLTEAPPDHQEVAKKVLIIPVESFDKSVVVEEETTTEEPKTILDKVLDKIVHRQNTTIKDMKNNFPYKIKSIKNKLNNLFNGTKDVEKDDFVDYVDEEKAQQAYMEAYYVYEYYDEKDPNKVLWSENANQTEIILLETATIKMNRTKVKNKDEEPLWGDQAPVYFDTDISTADQDETTSEMPELFSESSTTSERDLTLHEKTTTERLESTTTNPSSSNENSNESKLETSTFHFPSPENLVTLPSTTIETTSQQVASTENVPFTSTLTFLTESETTEFTTFDTSTLIETKTDRLEKLDFKFSSVETAESSEDSFLSGETTMLITTEFPTSTAESTIYTSTEIPSTSTPSTDETSTTVDFTTFLAASEDETSTVISFDSESTAIGTTESVNESTSTVISETTTQDFSTTDSFAMQPKIKALQTTTDFTTEDISTTDVETSTTNFMPTDSSTLTDFDLTTLPATSNFGFKHETSTFESETSTFFTTETSSFETTTDSGVSNERFAADSTDSTESTLETSAVPHTTTDLLRNGSEESHAAQFESSTVEAEITSTTEDFEVPTTSTLMPDTPYADIGASTENIDSRAVVFHLKDTQETTTEYESTTTQPTMSDNESSQSDPFGKLEQQPKESEVEYDYFYEEYLVLGDPNANMTEANNSSFKQKRDNSFEYYVESMSASREISPRS